MPVQMLTDRDFESEVLMSDVPVLIDFYADWCGPCKQIAPIVEDVATQWAGKLKVMKCDVEKNPGLSQAFRIQSIPFLAFVAGQQVVDAINGAVDRAALFEAVTRVAGPPGPSGGPETWDPQRVAEALLRGEAIAIDVRSDVDYNRVRLPGAVHVPADSLLAAVGDLKRRATHYVLYGRSQDAVTDLAQKASDAGLRTVILEGGLLGWEVARLPIERGAPN